MRQKAAVDNLDLMGDVAQGLESLKNSNPKTLGLISKLNLCKGGSFSSAIFHSGIQLHLFPISCFISVCPFVALLKAT